VDKCKPLLLGQIASVLKQQAERLHMAGRCKLNPVETRVGCAGFRY
jgi:hypothetical protein